MHPMPLRTLLCTVVCLLASLAHAGVTFSVTFDPAARATPASGRLIVMLIKDGSKVSPSEEPLKGPFWDDPQPMFGADVTNLSPGMAFVVNDSATSFPCSLAALPPGTYRAQARLDVVRRNSEWKRDEGNLYSAVVKFTVDATDRAVPIVLSKATTARAIKPRKGVDVFSVKSRLLSDFYGREIMLRVGVGFPVSYDPTRTYAAIYNIPGYGGDFADVYQRNRASEIPGSAEETLAKNTFAFYLDPESPNGHTLFADSDNNGPWAKALTTELVPALEAQYKLVAKAPARLLRGHSSGGWSTLWLALNYPETFGATWSSSPDPVDFRKFQVIDIYGQRNFYYDPAGKVGDPKAELTSYRKRGEERMTIRQENLMEEVIGPENTSAQQWDSWFAAWGPKTALNHPENLFDVVTGEINHGVAQQYRRYDIADRLRGNPQKYLPIFRSSVRILVGDQDNFSLNEAVALLKADLEKLEAQYPAQPPRGPGYVKILPGLDHGTIMTAPEIRRIPAEMLEHLKAAGITVK